MTKRRILLVDDSPTTRKMVLYLLKGRGYDVVEAGNGFEALEKVDTNEIDLIISDLNMPQMDGIEFVKNLRNDEQFTGLPVVIITTESGENDKKAAIEAGANEFLTKPFSQEELLKVVGHYLE